MDNSQNKTLLKDEERNKVRCGHRRRIIVVPVVIQPVVVPVPLVVVPVEVTNHEVAVGVAVHVVCRPCHHPLNTLWVESNSASYMP